MKKFPAITLAALLLGELFVLGNQLAPAPELFLPVAGRNVLAPPQFYGVARSSHVQLNPEILQSLTPGQAHRMNLSLFGETNYIGVLESAKYLGVGTVHWQGSLEGVPHSTFSLTLHNGAVALNLKAPHHPFHSLRYAETGETLLCEEAPKENFCHGPVSGEPLLKIRSSASAGSPAAAAAAGLDDPVYVDVAVFYTDVARAAAGGTSQIQAKIFSDFQAIQAMHHDSDTETQFRLVHYSEVPYNEAGYLDNHLERLANSEDGIMDQVHAIRAQLGADLVTLYLNDLGASDDSPGSPTLGVAYTPGSFSVVNRSQPPLILAHELGHNLGLCHQKNLGPCGISSFAHGWKAMGNWTFFTMEVTTIMYGSYGENSINRFSNPLQTYTFVPGGLWDNQTVPLGSAINGDNTRALREYSYLTAQFVNPKFYADAARAGGYYATIYDPSQTVEAIFRQWHFSTRASTAEPVEVNIRAGNYPTPVRMTVPARLKKWDGSGPVRLGGGN